MAIVISPQGDILNLEDHLDRLKSLVADIEGLKSGNHPDVGRIAGTAYIRDWTLDSRPTPCLRGFFEGHPKIRSGRMGITSDVWIFAPHHGYARSLSRWYQLGPRAAGHDGSGRR